MPRVEEELVVGNNNNNNNNTFSSSTTTIAAAADLLFAEQDNNFMFDLDFPLTENNDFPLLSSLIPTPSAPPSKADWFLAPETWQVSHGALTSVDAGLVKATMKKYIAVLQSWLERWVNTGSNPFIHARLYSANFPACVQVAYATLASYIHRTPANEDAVFQIVEDRCNDLVRENGAVLSKNNNNNGDDEAWVDQEQEDVTIDLFAQLARLQALVIYQIIGLFDGDIRSRHVSESRLSLQESWCAKLFQTAGKILPLSTNPSHSHPHHLHHAPSSTNQQWHLWILSESIRRTWLVSKSVNSVFRVLQRQWSSCPGGVMYTNRAGLWDALSASEWDRHRREKNVVFLQRFECIRLLDDDDEIENNAAGHRNDLDEFGLAMLDMTFSGELVEKWNGGSGGDVI